MPWDDGFSFDGYQGQNKFTLSGEDNGMAAFSSIAAGVGALGSVIGGVGQAMGGGQTVQGFQLPEQLGFQFIDTILSDIDQYDQNINDLNYAIDNFDKRLDVFDAALDGFLPPEGAMEAMTTLAYDLAAKFGDRASDLVDQGFLTKDELESKQLIDQEISQLQSLRDRNFTDPRLEQQLKEQEAQLRQDLLRSGASPSQVAQALDSFRTNAEQSRFTRSEDLVANRFSQGLNIIGAVQQRNQMLQSGRFQNFQMAEASLNRLREGIKFGAESLQAKVNVGQLIQMNQLQGLQKAQEFRKERQDTFNLAGQFDFKGQNVINQFMRGRASGSITGNLADPTVQKLTGEMTDEEMKRYWQNAFSPQPSQNNKFYKV